MDSKSAMILEMREKGQFPLSIGTSLAFEGAFAIMLDNPNPPKPPIDSYKEVWVNLRTLFRNLYTCMKREQSEMLLPDALGEAMREEMSIIQGILAERTGGRVTAIFYANNYHSLTGLFQNAIFKEAKTEKQKHYSLMENKAIDYLLKHYQKSGQFTILDLDTTLVGNERDALILTHYPLDLISNKKFGDIGLLESNTGAVKRPHQWYTKLKNGNELGRIPFNKMTIQLFGDSGDLFAPYPSDYRRAVIDCAENNKWTQTTTKDRIILTIQLLKMPQLEGLVRKMFV